MHVKTHFCTKNLGGCSCGKGPLVVGDRVVTAHGPAWAGAIVGGTIVRVEEARCLVECGVTNENVAQVWCDVLIDGADDQGFRSEMLLDWRSDGYGRIKLV